MHTLLKIQVLCILTSNMQKGFGSRIIHGEKVPDGMLQYMASLQTNKGEHFCGGFLISDQFVLTAEHCQHPHFKSVVIGTHDLNNVDNTVRYGIKKCKGPLTFNLGADIMLLKLSRPCLLQPVPLPKPGMKLLENSQCKVVGWGATKTQGHMSSHLYMVDVSIIDPKICSDEWGLNLPEELICAGGYNTDKGFCQGDSGGPLVCNGTAVGIVSFNYRKICDYPSYPNVYNGLDKFLPWVTEVLAKNDC